MTEANELVALTVSYAAEGPPCPLPGSVHIPCPQQYLHTHEFMKFVSSETHY
jgi:hypothetical protein